MSEAVGVAARRRVFARESFGRCLAVTAALTGLGDWLFGGGLVGASELVFLPVAAAGMAICGSAARAREAIFWAGFMLICVLPSAAGMGALEFGFALGGLAYVSAGLAFPEAARGRRARLAWLVARGVFWRIFGDAWRAFEAWLAAPRARWDVSAGFVWAVPVGLGAVFLGLFATANPVVGAAVTALNPVELWAAISWGEVWFWVWFSAFMWPFVAAGLMRGAVMGRAAPPARAARVYAAWGLLLGKAAILRSLAVFNVMFAVQTGMDLWFLWGGAKLPAGMSYADYAHQGAYQLILTASLAGVFCVAASWPGSAAAKSRVVKGLVLVWIFQNFLLVGSAVWRLRIYVETYGLTELRLAAAVWMGLVAVGLGLIVVRILGGFSNGWLVRANAAVMGGTLYLCSLSNFAHVVAMYDARHCYEVTGKGAALDLDYLVSLGPQAIPALDYVQVRTVKTASQVGFAFLYEGEIGRERSQLEGRFWEENPDDWRGWTVWSWYLRRYLVAHEVRG